MGPISPSEVSKLYSEALAKLTFNSRPVIMSLTEMAHEYASQHADVIVNVITEHIKKTKREMKLPALYLIDSIVKNHPEHYRVPFQKNVVAIFSHVFSQNPDVNVRAALYKLRNTWNEVFEAQRLVQLDVKVRTELDPKWPVQSNNAGQAPTGSNIHINPAVFARKALDSGKLAEEAKIEEELKRKRMELMRLENQKLEMQIAAKKKELGEDDDQGASKNVTTSPARKVVITQAIKPQESRGGDKASVNVKSEASTTRPVLTDGTVSTTSRRQASRDPRTRSSEDKSVTSKKSAISSSRQSPTGKRRGTSDSTEKSSKRSKNDDESKTTKGFRIPKVKAQESEKRRVSFGDALNKSNRTKGKRLAPKKNVNNAKKKAKFTEDLFGEEEEDELPSKGWSKFKERNPDNFRKPLQTNSGKVPRTAVEEPNPAVFDLAPKPWSTPQNTSDPNYLGLLLQQQVAGVDPRCIMEKVIPDILAQSQASLQMGSISQEQFKDIIHQVVQLKEQAMISQADQQQQPQPSQQQHLPQPEPTRPQQPLQGPVEGTVPQQQGVMPPQSMPPPMRGPRQPRPPFERRGGLLPRPPLPPSHVHAVGFRPPGPMGPVPKPVHRDLAMARPEELAAIDRDTYKSIQIDNEMREIRFYQETAVCVMSSNEVREVSFRRDTTHPSRLVVFKQAVFVDNAWVEAGLITSVEVNFDSYTDFTLDNGQSFHRLKIGAPTRELFLDENQWLECFFDATIGPVHVGNVRCFVTLNGPCPEVRIGDLRSDLCAGFVQLIPDGNLSLQQRLYLDSKPQRMDLEGKPHVLRFVENKKILLINDHPFVAEFGGLPKVVYVNGNRHYLRLSSLPEEYVPPAQEQNVQQGTEAEDDGEVTIVEPEESGESSLKTIARPEPTTPSSSTSLDRILNLLPHSSKPKETTGDSMDTASESDYKLEQPASQKSKPTTEGPVNVHDLFSQLLGAGLISGPSKTAIPGLAPNHSESKTDTSVEKDFNAATGNEATCNVGAADAPVKNEEDTKMREPMKHEVVLESHHPSLRIRNASAISDLFESRTLQCKMCGLRFLPTDVVSYSQHLDWHYRMNARAKRNSKRPQSRSWLLEAQQWVLADDVHEEEEEKTEESDEPVPTVNMGDDLEGVCAVCNEPIEQFYDQDEELWKFRNAVRVENVLYHPQCLSDLQHQSPMDESNDEEAVLKEEADTSVEQDEKPITETNVKEESDTNADTTIKEETDNTEETDTKETFETMEQAVSQQKSEASEQEDEELSEETNTLSIKVEVKTEHSAKAEQEPSTTEENQPNTEPSDSVASSPKPLVESSSFVGEQNEVEATIKAEADTDEDEEMKEEVKMPKKEDEIKDECQVDEPMETEATESDTETPNTPAEVEPKVTTPVVEELAPILSALATSVVKKADIKLNLTSNIGSPKSKEELDEEEETTSIQPSEFDPDAIIQEKSLHVVKEGVEGKKFSVMPPQQKDAGVSGLCVIM